MANKNDNANNYESLVSRLTRLMMHDLVEETVLHPGDRLPSTRQLAERYDASVASVSHALEVLQAQGFVEKRRGSGCYLIRASSPSQEMEHDTIGLVIPTVSTAPLMAHLYEGVRAACRRYNDHIIVSTFDYQYEQELVEIHRCINAGCKAVILYPMPRTAKQAAEDHLCEMEFPVPLVLVDLCLPAQGHTQVLFDNHQAGFDMTSYLLGKGHKRIAFQIPCNDGVPLCYRSVDDRYSGYKMAMGAAGADSSSEYLWKLEVRQRMADEDAVRLVTVLLKEWRQTPLELRPTAVITLDDSSAVDLVMASQDLGISIPDDLMVTGFDNLPVRRSVRPPFPTTAGNFNRAGMAAVDLAIREIKGLVKPPLQFMLPVPLIIPERRRTERY